MSKEFFAEARRLCSFTGALLIADEIQCGFGRTGKWFAYEHFGILPDVTTVAKPLAGGLPCGAMLCTESASSAMTPGMHGTTFGGGPLVSAVAIAVIDEIRRAGLLRQVAEVGAFFKCELTRLAGKYNGFVRDVRGSGLMLGMELASEDLAKGVAAAMLARHILLNRTSETVLRFLPPYILECQHVVVAITALDDILATQTARST